MISEFGNTDMVVVCFLICVPNLLTFGSVLDHVGTIRMVVLCDSGGNIEGGFLLATLAVI